MLNFKRLVATPFSRPGLEKTNISVRCQWLLERLLIPAGILPPAISYEDLQYNEGNRRQIGNTGFEYVFLMDQDADKINASPIGGKIRAVHAPFPAFGHASFGENKFLIELITNFLYGKNRIPNVFAIVAQKTFAFARAVGARVVVFHTYHLDHKNIRESLATLAKMEEKFQILTVIEHEGNYIDSWLKSAQNFRRFNGKLDWLTRPAEMIRALDSFYPRKKFGLCLDTSSLYGYSLPIMETAQKVWGRVAHLHLAGSVPGQDLAAEINQPEIAELVKFFSRHKYSGFITAEVNGTVGKLEALIAQIYGASSIVGLPVLKSRGVANAQRHIRRSCQYLLSHAD